MNEKMALPPVLPRPIGPGGFVPKPVLPHPGPAVHAMPTPVLGGAIGCDFRRARNQLVFVEFAGKLSRLDLYPTATVHRSGSTVLQGTWSFDLDAGVAGGGPSADMWWEQQTAVQRQLVPQNGATIVNLGAVDFATLSSAGLQSLPYGTAPIPGNNDATNRLVPGDVFAVRTTAGNYAKVRVVSYGYNLSIEWVTYTLDPAYAVLGTGYAQPEDVRASADGVHAYVTERTGDLLRVDLSNADRVHATVVASGMNAPQQLFLDENAGYAYTVEYAVSGALWRVDLATGTKTAVLTGLDHAVGIVISSDGQYAYVSEQTTGPDSGRVSRYRFSNGQRTGLATGLTAPFFLTWTDATETGLYCPQRDPANSLVLVDPAGGSSVVASALATRPSCTAVVSPGLLLVTCDQVIEEIALAPAGQQPNGPLLQSVGFVPFDWITPGGLADTTSHDPTYFFQVHDAPFGGSLPIMVNFVRAGLDGASFYKVTVDGAADARADQFHTAKWNGTEYTPVVVGTQTVNGQSGYYAVPTIAELMLYIQPLPGCYLDSTNLADGVLHTIEIEFFDAGGNPIESATPLHVLVDNRPCAVTLAPAAIGASSATTDCGYLKYDAGTKATDDLTIAYTATQPGGFGMWAFGLTKAAHSIASASGAVPAPGNFHEHVADVLGTCTVAAYAAQVVAYATATTGWGRCSQYDRSLLEAFALAP